MKPKKKKAGKSKILAQYEADKAPMFKLASHAFDNSIDRAKMCPNCLPIRLIQESILHLARGKPLVFAHIGDEFIICDPRTYAQMVGKTGG